mmetsp:Transcript_21257/g.51061  ORF Transcript_21257/g.51061 Transcript_21257/m.51061 type:complete len:214 (-) Transcript_21257:582-1223(-)
MPFTNIRGALAMYSGHRKCGAAMGCIGSCARRKACILPAANMCSLVAGKGNDTPFEGGDESAASLGVNACIAPWSALRVRRPSSGRRGAFSSRRPQPDGAAASSRQHEADAGTPASIAASHEPARARSARPSAPALSSALSAGATTLWGSSVPPRARSRSSVSRATSACSADSRAFFTSLCLRAEIALRCSRGAVEPFEGIIEGCSSSADSSN